MKERHIITTAIKERDVRLPERRPASLSSAADEKRNRRRGFTLAETLAAVLILLMVSAVVAAGIPAAVRAYEKVTRRANAEVLLSTSVSALRGRLGTARSVAVSGKAVTYYSTDTGSFSRIYPDPKSGVLKVQEYIFTDPVSGSAQGAGAGSGDSGEDIPGNLVTDSAATKDLYITYDSVSAGKGILHIEGLRVRRKSSHEESTSSDEESTSSDEEVTSLQTLEIRIFSDIPTDG